MVSDDDANLREIADALRVLAAGKTNGTPATGGPANQGYEPPWWQDPTKNVESLVAARDQRQDDLRSMQAIHDRELRLAEMRRVDDMARLRADHAREMRQTETQRIDAIRLVDVGAVQRAAEVQAQQAQTLAGQVATTADAFRASLAAALAPIQASIEDLRRAQYEAQGKTSQVVESRDTGADARADAVARAMQVRATISIFVAAFAGLIALVAVVAFVLK